MNRYLQLFICVFFIGMLSGISAYAQDPDIVHINTNKEAIEEISLNGKWQFHPATDNSSMSVDDIDSYAGKVTQGTADWYTVSVPQFLNHVIWWNKISQEYELQEDKRISSLPFDAPHTQSGWYRKSLVFDNTKDGTLPEVCVDFEGVAMISRVYCNGHYVGGHLGMFGSFCCRLTPYLNWKEKNTILVYVERGAQTKDADQVVSVAVTAPITKGMLSSLNAGLFGGFGNGPRGKSMGIWQPVTLKISQPGGKIKDIFFNPSLHGHHIEFTIHNPMNSQVTGIIEYSLKNLKTGHLLVKDKLKQSVVVGPRADKKLTVDKDGLNPELWTPDQPALYSLEVDWLDNKGHVIDSQSQDVGYRTVSVNGQQIYLNGHPYWVRGANTAPYGYKPDDSVTAYHFLQLMHDGNTMVTRSHGNPWNNLWYSAADKIGIGVSAEGVRPWALMTKAPAPPEAILEHWEKEQLETVKQYRNHPSILFYEVSNEGLQGDAKNPAKLAILKKIIDSMRKLDPSRPIIQTSGDTDYQNIADIEDIHSYWGWYESSSYVNDYTKPMRGLTIGDGRPFMNEECAIPYSSVDNGKVLPFYVPLYSAQPWVGNLGVFGNDISYYQEHIRAEAKMKAEKLRYSRQKLSTAGFMLFCNATWIEHALSRPASQWDPFPVYNAVKQAFQPVLVAWQTPQRVFYAGDRIDPDIYVVNDDTNFSDLSGLELQLEVVDSTGKVLTSKKAGLGDVAYYAVKKYPLEMDIPRAAGDDGQMIRAKVVLRLTDKNGRQVSYNTYQIRIASYKWASHNDGNNKKLTIAQAGCGKGILSYLKRTGMQVQKLQGVNSKADIVLLGPDAKDVPLQQAVSSLKPDGRLIVLEQAVGAHRFCQDIIVHDTSNDNASKQAIDNFMYTKPGSGSGTIEKVKGEFVEMLGWEKKLPVFNGLAAMDWKWWMQGDTLPAFACIASHKINIKDKDVIALGRFLSPHFYWGGNLKKVYQSNIGYPVFVVKRKWGKLIVCDLAIKEALPYDPRAAKTLTDLMTEPVDTPAIRP